jgi:hypothetical protein
LTIREQLNRARHLKVSAERVGELHLPGSAALRHLRAASTRRCSGTRWRRAIQQAQDERFPNADNQNVAESQAFSLGDAESRAQYADTYERSRALYYEGKPSLAEILAEIQKWIDLL